MLQVTVAILQPHSQLDIHVLRKMISYIWNNSKFFRYLIGQMSLFTFLFLFFSVLFGSEEVVEDQAAHTLRDLGLDNKGAIQRGKRILEDYQSRNSPCWMRAIQELQSKCSETTDIERSILAIKFTNCHFEKSGLKTYDCTEKSTFLQCTKSMRDNDASSFIIYTEFFTHVTDICFYLQSDIWRQKTAETIAKLSYTTDRTIDKLDESLHNQDLVLKSQERTLRNQRQIIKREESLKNTLDASTQSARAAFDEMKQKAAQQEALFSQTFDDIFQGIRHITKLQAMFLGEFISLQSLAFYVVSIITCYLFTSVPRTMAARLPLFMLFALLVVIEKCITDKALAYKELHGSTVEWIHEYVWLARKVFMAVSLFALGYCAVAYKDHSKINNKLLQEIHKKMTLMCDMEVMKESNMAIDGADGLQHNDKQQDLLPVEPKESYTPLSYKQSPLVQSSSSTEVAFLSDISDEDMTETKSKRDKEKFLKMSPKESRDLDREQISNNNGQNDTKTPRYYLRRKCHSRQEDKTPVGRKKTNFMENTGLFSSDDEF